MDARAINAMVVALIVHIPPYVDSEQKQWPKTRGRVVGRSDVKPAPKTIEDRKARKRG